MASNFVCSAFDPELETISEFFMRFQCQQSDLLTKCRNDEIRKANLLLKFLPVSVISELQRRLAPTLLFDATYDILEEQLTQQYQKAKSTVGASVTFLTCKQQSGQSLEDYARKLNSLASVCNYPSDCLDRLLRDIFVSGLSSSTMLSSLIQVCDQLSFRETVERAKLLETYRQDAHNIHSQRSNVHINSDYATQDVNKVDYSSRKFPAATYICYRCGIKGQHFSDNCAARTRTCHLCKKIGHIARICQSKNKQSNRLPQRPLDNDSRPTVYFTNPTCCIKSSDVPSNAHFERVHTPCASGNAHTVSNARHCQSPTFQKFSHCSAGNSSFPDVSATTGSISTNDDHFLM